MPELIERFLAESALPNIHPVLVHFPLALLPLGALLDAGAVLFARRWFDRVALPFYVLGTAIGWWAMETGEHAAEDFGSLPLAIEREVTSHSDWAHRAIYLFAGLAVLRLAVTLRDRTSPRVTLRPVRLVLLLAAGVGLFFLLETAEHGGRLVYRHGLGVQGALPEGGPSEEVMPGTVALDAEATPADRLRPLGDGWVWTPRANDVVALDSVMVLAAEGGTLAAVPEMPGSEVGGQGSVRDGLVVDFAGATMLLFPQRFGDLRVEATLEVETFRGAIGLAHHVEGVARGHWFALGPDGGVALVARDGGDRTTLASGRIAAPDGRLELSVSSVGKHLKGLVGDEVVVHGHEATGDVGRAGLYFEGSGRVRILRLAVEPA